MTNCQKVHAVIRDRELTRAEIKAATGLSDKQIDSALSVLLKYKSIRYNGIVGHRTYIAVVAAAPQDRRGKSAGSRAGAANLELSPKRLQGAAKSSADAMPDYPQAIHGGPQPRPVMRHALDIAWHPFFPITRKLAKRA